MASVLEPEVQFAQKLASNEKPTRSKAVKKLRKYISARSRRETGGFSEEELLKLWKGLFYCLWMQDKPLLQEELSTQITTLIHHFHSYDQQLLFLRTFLHTVKREWTGIDRLRMDKFFQMVRFMFRQSFEVLQRSDWDQSHVGRFLELLSSELLQGGAPPAGLQMHVLDLYLRELAVVGAQQLTADQNLTFIEPFCKIAAKTKDRCLFRAICNSIFSLIIDQAPFAIEELLKEVEQGSDQDQDSGQDSDQDEPEEEAVQLKTKRKAAHKTRVTKQMNGTKSHSDLDDDDDEDELLDSDSEQIGDEDMGPVLQFDYGAVADKLLELSSRGNTPSRNRQRLYKIVKVLRDLSQGNFPQDEYPEEVSTDEDDDDFGSRKRMKRKHSEEEEQEQEQEPEPKKGKKQKLKKTSAEPNTDASSEEVQKKKRKKKKKKKQPQNQTDTVAIETKPETEAQSEQLTAPLPHPKSEKSEEATSLKEESERLTPADQDLSEEKPSKKKKKKNQKAQGLTPEIEAKPETEVQSEPQTAPDKSEEAMSLNKESVTMMENQDLSVEKQPETVPQSTKRKKANSVETTEEKQNLNDTQQAEIKEEDILIVQSKPKKKKNKKAVKAPSTETDLVMDISETNEQLESTTEEKSQIQTEDVESHEQETPKTEDAEDSSQKKKKKKKKTKALEDAVDVLDLLAPETDVTTAGKKNKGTKTAEENVNDIPKKKKKRASEPAPEDHTQTIPKKKKRKIPVEFEYEADEIQIEPSPEIQDKTPVKLSQKQKQKKKSGEADFVSFQSGASPPTPLFCRARGPGTPRSANMKCVTPKSDSKKVTFGLKNNKTAEFRKSDRSLLLSPDGSSRVPFDPEQKPKCGVLKSTPVGKGKKTPMRKSGVRARPTAADFF